MKTLTQLDLPTDESSLIDSVDQIAPNRKPTPVLFVQTSMPVGGAETLLVNLVKRMDRSRFLPEVVCLKELGPLGEALRNDGVTIHHSLLSGKYDLRILPRLVHLIKSRKYEAVITVGAGDKMFWGRLAAKFAGVRIIASALHSTGWPDGVGRLNRFLTPFTDAFIAVAKPHGEFLVDFEKFPQQKVVVIPNGVDTERFCPAPHSNAVREELGLASNTPLVSILAALRPEKNHELFLDMAKKVLQQVPETRFLIIGDGDCRQNLESYAKELGLLEVRPSGDTPVRFLGNRDDIPALLAASDVLALTSDNEANPVSILEGLSCGTPVVATDVGSVSESVVEGKTGFLVEAGNANAFSDRVTELLLDPIRAEHFGRTGRQAVIEYASLDAMVKGYERLVEHGVSALN